jgi:hypothetical protein
MIKNVFILVFFSVTLACFCIIGSSYAKLNPCYPPAIFKSDRCQNVNPPTGDFTPNVLFPTSTEIYDYLNQTGNKSAFVYVSNSSQGNASNIQTAITNKIIWMAWQGKIKESSHIFAAMSNDSGSNFTPPFELTNSNITNGNLSNLQLGVTSNGSEVFLAWESKNITSGIRSIFFSTSTDYGQTFRTYPLNDPNKEEFFDPRLKVVDDTIWLTWLKIRIGEGDVIAAGHGRHW